MNCVLWQSGIMFIGKRKKKKSPDEVECHPLVAHVADVVAVFHSLATMPVIASRLSQAAGRPLKSLDIANLCIITGLHDIGKYTPIFQHRIQSANYSLPGHLHVLPGLLDGKISASLISALSPIGLLTGENVSQHTAYLCTAFGHHGQPIDLDLDLAEIERRSRYWYPEDGFDPFAGILDLANHLRRWFPEADAGAYLPAEPATLHLFAGLVMLADWLGSDEDFFPYCGERGRPLNGDPFPYARQAAKMAVRRACLDLGKLRSDPSLPSFEDMFTFAPNAVQRAVEEVPLDSPGGLVILEAETGCGKTEAALRLFARLFLAGRVDSLYLANPLRLAATQLHARVHRFIADTFLPMPPPTILAIPGYLKADEAEGYKLPDNTVGWEGDVGDQKHFWACEHPKRFLAAPVAVGTIDQALLAGLRVKHAHLRAASLSRSLLVVDEVHASDAYMTELTLNLIRWLHLCGGHVLLMSATLGGEVRQRYMDEAAGLPRMRQRRPGLDDCRMAPYPLFSWAGGQGFPLKNESPPVDRHIRIEAAPIMRAPEALAELTAGFARQGGCILVLRNTVARAVETAQAVEAALGHDSDLLFRVCGISTVHHGRFAREDRILLDQEAVAVFGKDGAKNGRRRPCILMSTQTMEQSLDVDFDLIITDLCPMDILLQRIGRLHRHANTRPRAFQLPLCIVLVPEVEATAWLGSENAKKYGFGPDRAYENILCAEATRQMVTDLSLTGEPLRIPSMNRELVENATHSEALQTLAAELGPAWQNRWAVLAGSTSARRGQAHQHAIAWDQPFSPKSAGGNLEAGDRAVTRLGLDDALAQFDPAPIGPFGQPLTLMRLPGWMVRGEPYDLAPSIVNATDGVLRFRWGSKAFVYDRFGLRKGEG